MNLIARNAEPRDYPSFCRLFPELRIPDPVTTESEFRARIVPHAFFLFAEADPDNPVGYAFFHLLGDTARIVHVIVAHEWQGKGVGRALMREIAHRAHAAGCTQWHLHVKPDNEPAVRLYRASGMTMGARIVALRFPWDRLGELSGEALEASVVRREEDAAVERDLGFPEGQITTSRQGAERHILAIREGGTYVACASFDPSFPGAMPFKLRRPSLARPLLEAMRPFAKPESVDVILGIEFPDLEAECKRLGAVTHLEYHRMAGPIPAVI